MSQYNINKKNYDDKKRKQQEGFETYQECTPLTTEEGEEIDQYTVTKRLDASVTEDAQTIFIYMLIFLILAVVFGVGAPILTLYGLKIDQQDNGNAFRVLFTGIFVMGFIMSIYCLSVITSDKVKKRYKPKWMLVGIYLLCSVFFIYTSVTFARVSNMSFSENLKFGDIYPDPNMFLYVDIFALSGLRPISQTS
jgi:hypothetical protein